MYLYSSLLHRVSPLKINDIESFKSKSLHTFSAKIKSQEDALLYCSERLTDILFEKIQNCQDSKKRNKLLNCKRSIFNQKYLKKKETNLLFNSLPPDATDVLEQYIKLQQNIDHLIQQGHGLYKDELLKSRAAIQNMIKKNEAFHQSLQLSSQSLFTQLNPYLASPVDRLSKKQSNAELSFLKYLTRQYTKTSPFSRFTCLAIGDSTLTTNNQIKASARLNNYIYAYVLGLCMQVTDVAAHIPIKLNPSLTPEATHYTFLVNFNNVEIFQTIERNSAIDLIITCVDDLVDISSISQKLISFFPDSTANQLQNYLTGLLEVGILETNLNISGIDPDWPSKFISFLTKLSHKTSKIEGLLNGMLFLQQAANQLSDISTSDRQILLSKALEIFKGAAKSFCQMNHLPFSEGEDNRIAKKQFLETLENDISFKKRYFNGFYFTEENLFYEDASITINSALGIDEIRPLVKNLDLLLQELSPLAFENINQEKMTAFFNHYYENYESVPLIKFYESYYKNYVKPNKKGEISAISSSIDLLQKEQFAIEKDYKDKLKELLLNKKEVEGVINFTLDEIKGLNLQKSEPIAYSKAAHIQFYKNNKGDIQGVVNSVFTGYGRGYGRFLHLFPKQITEELNRINKEILSDYTPAEVRDASSFNANLHPSLLPHEIIIPGGNPSLSSEQQISIENIIVKHNHGKVSLAHALTGKTILPFDLCLQTSRTRSELYQLLTSFSQKTANSIYSFVNHIHNIIGEQDINHVIMIPRIAFENDLVLSRKCWKIPNQSLPENSHLVSEFDYYHALNKWRGQYGIPKACFLFITPTHNLASKNSTFDDYKPQYIDFESPLLVKLFRKATRKAGKYIRIEEMLPAKNNLLNEHVNETLVQWYKLNPAEPNINLNTIKSLQMIDHYAN
ncbi:lantibiotic dehydratase family protein [Fulvivirga maritima]|uniref:lantibiotic dehydratase n=1 Tax=Fulvivirga maritima TaxID=2904247 RepID=UPI001F483E29|nr:lantibiotic dehydratase [Fulvivirga maritima]UII26790.1 lantibiotic dehydratase family protein [Fulvivirga maritima]